MDFSAQACSDFSLQSMALHAVSTCDQQIYYANLALTGEDAPFWHHLQGLQMRKALIDVVEPVSVVDDGEAAMDQGIYGGSSHSSLMWRNRSKGVWKFDLPVWWKSDNSESVSVSKVESTRYTVDVDNFQFSPLSTLNESRTLVLHPARFRLQNVVERKTWDPAAMRPATSQLCSFETIQLHQN